MTGNLASRKRFVKTILIKYKANKSAWMAKNEWLGYIKEIDFEFARQRRIVLFISDNCLSDCEIKNLRSIKLACLPSNITAKIKPMNQSDTRNLNVNYRQIFMKNFLAYVDVEETKLDSKFFKINLLNAANIISNAVENFGFFF